MRDFSNVDNFLGFAFSNAPKPPPALGLGFVGGFRPALPFPVFRSENEFVIEEEESTRGGIRRSDAAGDKRGWLAVLLGVVDEIVEGTPESRGMAELEARSFDDVVWRADCSGIGCGFVWSDNDKGWVGGASRFDASHSLASSESSGTSTVFLVISE